MGADNTTMIRDIVTAVRKLCRAVLLDADRMSRPYGLTGAQSDVLRVLHGQGPLSSAHLSRTLSVTPSNITLIIDNLEKKGLVNRTRQHNDRRIVLIELTARGAALGASLPDPVESKLTAWLSDLDPRQVADLQEAVMQILKIINETPLTTPNADKGGDSSKC